jgi:hypothetical protein
MATFKNDAAEMNEFVKMNGKSPRQSTASSFYFIKMKV